MGNEGEHRKNQVGNRKNAGNARSKDRDVINGGGNARNQIGNVRNEENAGKQSRNVEN